jgi:hypothetical protein
MSTINVNNILPQSGNMVNLNGFKTKSTNDTIYLGDQNNIPSTSNSLIIGVGAAVGVSGQGNVAIGKNAMTNLTTGTINVSVGTGSGVNMTTGLGNTFVGSTAGQNVSTGDLNTCVGQSAGSELGSVARSNTMIGSNTGFGNSGQITGEGNTCIGHGANVSSNSVNYEFTLGSQVNVLRCQQTSITSLSDFRDKKEIEELPVGLDFIKGLKPVKFVWDERDENGRHEVKDFGFIAQDLKKSQEDAKLAETLKLVYEENPEKLEASYGKLIPILVKAIQDLSAKVEALEAEKK